MIRRAGPMCSAAQYDLLSAGHAGPALQRVRQITRRGRCHIAPPGHQGRRPLRADRVVRPYVRLSVMLCTERGRSMIRRAGPMCPAARYDLLSAGHAGPTLQRGAANHP